MRVRRARTSWVTSLTILALSLGDRVVNHLAKRCKRQKHGRQVLYLGATSLTQRRGVGIEGGDEKGHSPPCPAWTTELGSGWPWL